MKFADAPPGIKFALGENVKQSNWKPADGDALSAEPHGRRADHSRCFARARDYAAQWERVERVARRACRRGAIWNSRRWPKFCRRSGWVHCHSYRQDEILALIRTFDDYEITIGSLQHILEGYKVADAMAKHGATGSTFSDWWAYKFEVYRRDSVQRRADAPAEVDRLVQLRRRRAGPAPES